MFRVSLLSTVGPGLAESKLGPGVFQSLGAGEAWRLALEWQVGAGLWISELK